MKIDLNNYSKLLTIAIPVYNGGDALIQSVKSCFNISNINLEILIVDNCSNDNSIKKLKELKNLPIRIVENKKNFGRIGNWNKCLDLARGKYILFLFSNELIYEKNNIIKMIDLLESNKECSFINSPWLISDFNLTSKQLPKQFFKRTPGNGYFKSDVHIKSTIENGKLPFVPLQSNLIRMKDIKENNLYFDKQYPITTDGIFLSKLAINSKLIGFFDKPSIIWRYDAPGRMHGQVDLISHANQMFESFNMIDKLIKINVKKSIKNYDFIEYIFPKIFKARNMEDLSLIKNVLGKWLKLIKKYNVSILSLAPIISFRLLKSIFKLKTFLKVLKSR